jgi:DHA1 family bicyclomycin/chloramphenicol resistance-like MFS transporter
MENLSTLLLLVLIAVVGVFTLDVYLPGMPSMAAQFDVSLTQISYTFTAFSVMFAIMQLVHGTLSDVIGRKPVVLGGLSIAALATFFCIKAESYETLFAARLLQAMGISAFVVVNAIIRDLYAGVRAVQVRTLVATASGISISIAPTIGGLLHNSYDWQGGFIASLILIIMALVYAALFFNESNVNRSAVNLRLSELFKSYVSLFSDRNYLTHIVQAMLAFTVHFSFIIMSARIFVELLGKTPLVFGYLMIIYGGVYFLCGLASTWIAKKLPISALIKIGGICIGLGGLLMMALLILFHLGSWQVLLPMAVITLGVTMARASAITGALAPIPSKAGQGSAGLNLVQFAASAMIATIVSNYGSNPQLSISFLAIASSLLIIYLNKKESE